MKLIGIDYGKRRIGMAATDPGGLVISGLATVDRRRHPAAAEEAARIAREESAEALVVGLPLDVDGGDTAMSREAHAFGTRLAEMTGLPVHFVDESFTSRQAEGILRSRKKKQRRARANADRVAACLILEQFQKEHECDSSL